MNQPKHETGEAGVKVKRFRYDAAFKEEPVAHCERPGGDIHRTAVELGVNAWTLRDWVREHRRRLFLRTRLVWRPRTPGCGPS